MEISRVKEVAAGDLPQGHPPKGLVIVVTPLLAFAVGAVVVSALALALNLGRHHPFQAESSQEGAVWSLEEVRRRPAILFESLSVDRGVSGATAPK